VAAVCDFIKPFQPVQRSNENHALHRCVRIHIINPLSNPELILVLVCCRKIVDTCHGCQGPSCSCGSSLRFYQALSAGPTFQRNEALHRGSRIHTINLPSTMAVFIALVGFHKNLDRLFPPFPPLRQSSRPRETLLQLWQQFAILKWPISQSPVSKTGITSSVYCNSHHKSPINPGAGSCISVLP
jgi:hypothetical protein